ncbi:MAG: glycosyltransferase [Coriobacteriia bacterium]|nr:glycosyltransferase [Coriobacteriia bacterium]
MKISILGLCRGNGKIFIKAQISGVRHEKRLCFQSRSSSSGDLPCSVFPVEMDNDIYTCVVVLPFLAISQRLIIREIDSDLKTVSVFKKRITPFRARWESRFNYRLKKQLVRELTGYEAKSLYRQLSLYCGECISDEKENIIRGVVFMPPQTQVEDLSILCIDSKGSPIKIDPVFLGVEKKHPVGSSPESVQKAEVSIRLPGAPQDCCFILQDAKKQENNGFSMLEEFWYRRILEDTSRRMQHVQADPEYDNWFRSHRVKTAYLEMQRSTKQEEQPLFSLVVPLYNTPLDVFCEMVESVREQSYERWELVLVQASPKNSEVVNQANNYVSKDVRIKHIEIEENKGISKNTNVGIAAATGDYICFFDHDDLLEPDLLFEYAAAINKDKEIGLLYCDEDKISKEGYFYDPFFKPDFNLDLLRNNNYICHLLCIKRTLLDEVGLLRAEFDGAQDHDLTLRAIERTQAVHHVSKILYHWRASENSTAGNVESKSYATDAGIKAVQGHLDRMGIPATVEQSRRSFTYKVTYAVPPEQPLVSIIIPNKDNKKVLESCIDSILKKTTYANYEIIIVENNSVSEEVFAYYNKISQTSRIRVERYEGEFNFSKIINRGVGKSEAEYLVLLNNDTEVITPTWIERMLGICARADVGIVGAKLYYPDDTIQHAGIIIVPDVAVRIHRHLPRSNWGYFNLNDAEQDLSAVTAACAMVKRSAFTLIDGFNEVLAIAFNDIDYCLRVRELDLLVVYTPEVEFYHFESLSRGSDKDKLKQARFDKEAAYMRSVWTKYYVHGDPYHNKNLCSKDLEAQFFGINDQIVD